MKRVFCLLALALAASQASAHDLYWQPIDSLGGGDVDYARQTLTEQFGTDPVQWPDWIDPVGLYAPTRHDRLLVVRRPTHEPCGQYRYVIFGTVTADLRRDRLGEFCGGTLDVLKIADLELPDLEIDEGRVPDADGNWQRKDQHLRWRDGQWWLISP